MREGTEELFVRAKVQGDDKSGKKIQSILGDIMRNIKKGKDREVQGAAVTLRKGLPRFVVFIMCDEDAGGSSAIVKKEKEKNMQKKGKRKG